MTAPIESPSVAPPSGGGWLTLVVEPWQIEPGDDLVGVGVIDSVLFDGSDGGWLLYGFGDRLLARAAVGAALLIRRRNLAAVERSVSDGLRVVR